ncbi:MAG: DUF883 domain-containing protein [Pseudomonadota bacterium]
MSTLNNLQPDHAPTTDRATALAHSAIDNAATKARQIENDVRRGADRAGTKVTESRESVDKAVKDGVDQVTAFAKERPGTTVGLAFAAGVLASALLRR